MSNGTRVPPSTGSGYGRTIIDSDFEARRVIPSDIRTGSVIIHAYDGDESNTGNQGVVYVGFDSDVDDSSGFPLEPGDSLSIDIQNRSQGIWAYAEESGDELRYMATN